MIKHKKFGNRLYELKGVYDRKIDAITRRNEFKNHGRFARLIQSGNQYGIYVAG